MKRTKRAMRAAVDARASGATFRQAAAAARVHPATLCRWQAGDPRFQEAMVRAGRASWRLRHPPYRRPRRVPWHPLCPACGAPAEVRTAPGCLRFWRCTDWPDCEWASWRPRFPLDCPACDGPVYWSHSRRTVACGRCGRRSRPADMRISGH